MTEPAQPPTGNDVVVERDDGLFQIGLDNDAAGWFPCRTFAAVDPQTQWAQNAVDNSYGPLDGDRAHGLRSTSTQLPLTGAHSASSKDGPRSRARLSGSELG